MNTANDNNAPPTDELSNDPNEWVSFWGDGPAPTFEEMDEKYGFNRPSVKRRERAELERMRLLIQGAEWYPGMHGDIDICMAFGHTPGGTDIETRDFLNAYRRLVACGALKKWSIDLNAKDDTQSENIASQVVGFVSRALS